jgi:hypothetical protein
VKNIFTLLPLKKTMCPCGQRIKETKWMILYGEGILVFIPLFLLSSYYKWQFGYCQYKKQGEERGRTRRKVATTQTKYHIN